ncbi:hypothetical protein B0A50_08042 [Salinomyces thailandicus]|uniref:TAFII55 protein conserved region domain-containing protein n=1 Tax=Salinomyces thailandicus TaxID=706561 RepID=A0A4U0TKK2_9PEZI|nr:hypothetical protein B0A50_08042 [Salinomyces thailandica]
MPVLKLKTGQQQSHEGTAPQPPARAPASSPAPSSAAGPKIKIKNSQPPTPATEQPPSMPGSSQQKKPAQRKPTDKATAKRPTGKKRAADEDISPAAVKRAASGAQEGHKLSLKLKTGRAGESGPASATPQSATLNKIKLGGPKKPLADVRRPTLIARRRVPERPKGVGYDSEDSDREEDPAIQQGLVLRMQPGEDADRLRDAIANGRVGLKAQEGGMNVSLRFVTNDLRRAVVKVDNRMYGAVLVDLPCIVESMKSWDRKGWWKVADVHQMLLVLGRVKGEDEAKNLPLPRDVDKETMQYAHGLTPPMHYVRKRRFRRRVNYRQMENVEEEVERLLKEDDEWERQVGAQVKIQEYTAAEWERTQNEPEQSEVYDDELDADGEPVETTEQDYQQQWDQLQDEETAALEAQMDDAFAQDLFDSAEPTATEVITDSPAPIADQAASMSAVENAMASDPAAPTPSADTPAAGDTTTMQEEDDDEESDEDESSSYDDDEEDSPDVVDEDAAARAAERQQQLEEVVDLEREIAAARAETAGVPNLLLKRRKLERLGKLEEDLKMKRAAFGLDAED